MTGWDRGFTQSLVRQELLWTSKVLPGKSLDTISCNSSQEIIIPFGGSDSFRWRYCFLLLYDRLLNFDIHKCSLQSPTFLVFLQENIQGASSHLVIWNNPVWTMRPIIILQTTAAIAFLTAHSNRLSHFHRGWSTIEKSYHVISDSSNTIMADSNHVTSEERR